MPGPATPPAWERFADAVLQREALVCRVGRGLPPRDLPGSYVDHDDVDRILRRLPGLDGPRVAPVLDEIAPVLMAARDDLHASLDGDEPFATLVRRAGLGVAEAEVMAVLAAVEVEPRRQRLAVYVQDDVALPRVSLDLVGRLFPPPHAGVAAVAPGSRLQRAGLLALDEDGAWGTRTVELAPSVLWWLRGVAVREPALPPDVTQRPSTTAGDDGDWAGEPTPGRLLLLTGGDRARRRAAVPDDRPVLFTAPPADRDAWDALVRTATLQGAAVVLEPDEPTITGAARDRIRSADHLPWVVSTAGDLPLDQLPDVPWREHRVGDGPVTPAAVEATLGQRTTHPLTATQLAQVAAALPSVDGDVDAAVRRLAGGNLDALARRIRPRRGWDDLVVPSDQEQQLHELVARYRRRSTVYDAWGFRAVPSSGLVALFAGPSGTGKTLAAEVVAADLGLDVYKIDLSSVVSKYIGETEKNLERIFSAAAGGNVVLFFDEADALFGKRSDVSDAHDRYANIEVSYLLQRLEAYDGLVVMATNLQGNIDQAFLRRIHVSVEFSVPDEPARRRIWELSFPDTAPTEDLDLDFLARQFTIPGGAIRNTALAAAFLAADEDAVITMRHVVLGMKREFQKLGRLRTETEFDRYWDVVRSDAPRQPA